jgi:hypothetical protein
LEQLFAPDAFLQCDYAVYFDPWQALRYQRKLGPKHHTSEADPAALAFGFKPPLYRWTIETSVLVSMGQCLACLFYVVLNEKQCEE